MGNIITINIQFNNSNYNMGYTCKARIQTLVYNKFDLNHSEEDKTIYLRIT